MRKFEFSVIAFVMFASALIAGTAGLQQETPDYYKTLGLPEDCSQDDVKKAFRKLAKKYHPDKCKEPDAEEKFQKIGEGKRSSEEISITLLLAKVLWHFDEFNFLSSN